MFKVSISVMVLVITSLIGAPLAAQSYFMNDGQYRSETRMQVGLVIPFGSASRKIDRTPRLALTMASHRYSITESALRPIRSLDRKNSIALTLDDAPQLMLNGRQITKPGENLNLSTGAGIAIGVVAVVGLTALVVTTVENDIENALFEE